MHERVKTINKYYVNLEYDTIYINKKKVSIWMWIMHALLKLIIASYKI